MDLVVTTRRRAATIGRRVRSRSIIVAADRCAARLASASATSVSGPARSSRRPPRRRRTHHPVSPTLATLAAPVHAYRSGTATAGEQVRSDDLARRADQCPPRSSVAHAAARVDRLRNTSPFESIGSRGLLLCVRQLPADIYAVGMRRERPVPGMDLHVARRAVHGVGHLSSSGPPSRRSLEVTTLFAFGDAGPRGHSLGLSDRRGVSTETHSSAPPSRSNECNSGASVDLAMSPSPAGRSRWTTQHRIPKR